MPHKLPLDPFFDNILPRLLPTELALLSIAHPTLSPFIDVVAERFLRVLPPKRAMQQDITFENQIVPPTISAYSSSLVALCDQHTEMLHVLDFSGSSIELNDVLDSVESIVKIAFIAQDQLIVIILETGVSLYELKICAHNPAESYIRRSMALQFDVPQGDGSYRCPGEPHVECGVIITADSTSTSDIATAHLVIEESEEHGLVLKISIAVLTREVSLINARAGNCCFFKQEARLFTLPVATDDPLIAHISNASCFSDPTCMKSAVTDMTILLLRVLESMPAMSNVTLSSHPLRLLFPEGSLEDSNVVVLNPTQRDNGPWTMRISRFTAVGGRIFSVNFSPPNRTRITVVRVNGSLVTILRMDTRHGDELSRFSVDIGEPNELLGAVDSGDGNLMVLICGQLRGGGDCTVTHWYVIDAYRGGCVQVLRGDSVFQDTKTPFVYNKSHVRIAESRNMEGSRDSLGSDTEGNFISKEELFDNSFSLSPDGQLLSLVHRGQPEQVPDGAHDLMVYSVATGIIVDSVRSPAPTNLINEMEWDERSVNGSGVCTHQFHVVGGEPAVMITTAAFHSYWLSVKYLSEAPLDAPAQEENTVV